MSKNKQLIFIFLSILIICFPLVYKIQHMPVRLWDESRNAVNAIEMLQNKNYLVRTFNGIYDSWETKPPLLIWLQVASMKIFGPNIFAIRFPTILASILTCLIIVFFFLKIFNTVYTGLISAFILVTSQGYIGHHIARTGDHDALLVLFTTCLVLVSYLFIAGFEKRKNELQIFLMCIFITLGFFTKSISVFFITPGILICLLYKKQFVKIFELKFFYAGLILFLSTVFAFYYFHEKVTPGYLNDVWQNEWFPRASNTAGKYQYNQSPWYYYINNFFVNRFVPWMYLLPVLLFIFYKFDKDAASKSFVNYLLVVTTGFLFIISSVTTNVWYDAPVLPLLSMIIAISIVSLIRFLFRRFFINKKMMLKLSALILLSLLFLIPYINTLKFVSHGFNDSDTSFGFMLKNESLFDKTKSYKVFHTGFNSAVLFYVEALQYRNFNIQMANSLLELKDGELVAVTKPDDILILRKKFFLQEKLKIDQCYLFELKTIHSSN